MDAKVALIVAQSDNRVIGQGGDLPWHLPEDLKFFKRTTLGKPIIMGRKTFQSIGKPLPERINIVVTRDRSFQAEGVVVVPSVEEALNVGTDLAHIGDTDEVMVIGGGEIYQATLPLADRIYLTQVHIEIEGDVFFPELDAEVWEEVERSEVQSDTKTGFTYSWLTLERPR
jgi:dihydrofolate reductase